MKQVQTDPTNPTYYKTSKIECIDAIGVATEGLNGMEGFDIGQVIKYCWRWKKKNGLEDLRKARWYLNHLIKRLEREEKQNETNKT